MEDYLQYVKTLRSQMNDVEDQATKVSVEELMQLATIHTLENDLASDPGAYWTSKNQVGFQTCRKENLLLEGIRDINSKLQQQQEWISSHRTNTEVGMQGMDTTDELGVDIQGNANLGNHVCMDSQNNDSRKNLLAMVDSAKAKRDEILHIKSELTMENHKTKLGIEQVNFRERDFKPELRALDIKTLEDEYNVLLSDAARETEYLKSLQDQIEKLKGISHEIKCACGEEYKMEVDSCV